MKIRKRLTPKEALELGLEVKPTDKGRTTARYTIKESQYKLLKGTDSVVKPIKETPFDLSAWTKEGKIMNIDEFCLVHNLNRGDISNWRLCTHTKVPTYNITFKENKEIDDNSFSPDFIEELVKKHINPIKLREPIKRHFTSTFDRLIFTDVHIGMTTNKDGYALYGSKWDEEELMNRLSVLVSETIVNKSSTELYIDDLGDYLDGWDAQTTRKGHQLPQNMDNQKAFDVAVNFKVKLIDNLVNYYDKITMNNICEDNHAGSFGYVVNSAVKSILELKYTNVKIVNHRKFINHYFVGQHCFVISHGKDSKNLKFGFKPVLDPKQVEKIDQYCKHNKIYNNSEFIEFSKGDSHQAMYDYATSDDFDYCNYPAFSPSSEWVQTNFKKGRSGFVFATIDLDTNNKTVTPYWFK